MDQKIKKLITDVLYELNYDNNDEELYKYLSEKGIKALIKIEQENYSLEYVRNLIKENIPTLISEYKRLKMAIENKKLENTMFGVSINYQLIDLFNIAKSVQNEQEFNELKEKYLSEQIQIFDGLKECTYNEIINIYNNICENCDVITPEAEGKMTLTIRSNQSLYDYAGNMNCEIFDFNYLDKIILFAKENNMKVRLHTLMWHKHFPVQLAECTKEQCLQFLDIYFNEIVSRYGEDTFSAIDVLNEISADVKSDEFKNGETLRNSPWREKLGDIFFIDVLKIARKNFPNSDLVYNEYDETNEEKRKKIISIIEKIKEEEIKTGIILLDSVGLQSHYHEYTSDSEIKNTYSDFSKVGKNIQVSELDISKISNNDDRQVNRVIRTVLDCAASYKVNYITCWGPTSKISWKAGKVRTMLDDTGSVDQNMKKIISSYSMKKKEKTKEQNKGQQVKR